MSDNYKKLVKRYADGRELCNCQKAYYSSYDSGAKYCLYGRDANIAITRDEIADRIVKEFGIK